MISEQILGRLQYFFRKNSDGNMIALHEPYFKDTNAHKYVKECIDSGWVSSSGEWILKFEQKICEITDSPYSVAVTNGTAALKLSFHLAGVNAGEEVLIPSLTFVATANAISHLGAVPHFVDIEPLTNGLCPKALARRLESIAIRDGELVFNKLTGRRIAAICLVHVFGHPGESLQLLELSKHWNLPLVEDAAEALGSFRENVHCGLAGKMGTLSFNGNKIVTTGGGGAIITNDQTLADQARHLATTAKQKHPWEFIHDCLAWNDRMPNINAALGVAQLEELDYRIKQKRSLFSLYEELFVDLEGISLVKEPKDCNSNYWLITLQLDEPDPINLQKLRSDLLHNAHALGYQLRPVWRPLHRLPIYSDCPQGDLSVTECQSNRLINLPSSPQLMNLVK